MKHEMNFLPIVVEKKKGKIRAQKKTGIIFIALLLGVLLSYGSVTLLDLRCRNEINKIEAIIANKNEYQVINETLANQKALLEHRRLLRESIKKGSDLPLQMLVELYNALPAGVQIVRYDFDGGRLLIEGTTEKKESILEFEEALSAREVFTTINLVDTNKNEEVVANAKVTGGQEAWIFTFDIRVTEI